jgi:CheY-like chemotaxis protein
LSLTRLLERHGYTVTAVADGHEALYAAERTCFDLVLTDAIMPGLSGIALADQLRATCPRVAVVVMSGYSREMFEDTGIASELVQLRKPFTTPQLLDALHAALALDASFSETPDPIANRA